MSLKTPDPLAESRRPLLFRMHEWIAIFVLVVAGITPFANSLLERQYPFFGLVGAAVSIGAYYGVRFAGERRSFGPLFLTMIDMYVMFGNVGVFILSAINTIRRLF